MKPIKERKTMISKDHSTLSIVKQYSLLKLHRSGIYYKPKGKSTLNLELHNKSITHAEKWFGFYHTQEPNAKPIAESYDEVMDIPNSQTYSLSLEAHEGRRAHGEGIRNTFKTTK